LGSASHWRSPAAVLEELESLLPHLATTDITVGFGAAKLTFYITLARYRLLSIADIYTQNLPLWTLTLLALHREEGRNSAASYP
jgi:hypothetical protein